MTAAQDDQEQRRPIESPKLLVVEGKEDKRVFDCLLKYLSITSVEVRPFGGKDGLKAYLRLVAKSPGFQDVESLGIVRDADADPANAFKAVRDALREVQLAVPKACGQICVDRRRVGVMILPGKDRTGALEDLCLESVQGDGAMKCVDEYFDCLVEQGLKVPSENAKKKAHVFIASRSGSARLLGEAAEAGVWPWDSPAFCEVKRFLRSLFAS